jgi:hypothetical protein
MPEWIKQHFDGPATGSAVLERLAVAWCRVMHDSAMWPVHGQYECRSCGRHYPVPWVERRALPRGIGMPVFLHAGKKSNVGVVVSDLAAGI